jgi:hypothetical protein
MKKILAIAIVLLMVPLSAYALEMLTEDVMDNVTGQAGVSIAVDDVKIWQAIDGLTYTDTDGLDGTAGSISLSNLQLMVNINAITHLDGTGLPVSPGRALMGTYDVAVYDYGNQVDASGVDTGAFQARPVTIDVGSMAILSEGLSYNMLGTANGLTVAGVRIGLPTLEIYQSALSFDVTVSEAGAANSGASYGNISIGQQTVAILDGFIEIAPH